MLWNIIYGYLFPEHFWLSLPWYDWRFKYYRTMIHNIGYIRSNIIIGQKPIMSFSSFSNSISSLLKMCVCVFVFVCGGCVRLCVCVKPRSTNIHHRILSFVLVVRLFGILLYRKLYNNRTYENCMTVKFLWLDTEEIMIEFPPLLSKLAKILHSNVFREFEINAKWTIE